MSTYYGDADFSGTVTLDDFSQLSSSLEAGSRPCGADRFQHPSTSLTQS